MDIQTAVAITDSWPKEEWKRQKLFAAIGKSAALDEPIDEVFFSEMDEQDHEAALLVAQASVDKWQTYSPEQKAMIVGMYKALYMEEDL